MNRRKFIHSSGAILALTVAGQARAAEAWIEKLNDYFNGIRTAFAPFLQVNPDGSKIGGRFYLYKPGKMRFEYDSEAYPLVVADGQTLAIFDPKSRLGAQKYPQNSTPVSLIARNDIDLTGTKFVRKINQNASSGEALITLADPDRLEYGSLILRVDTKGETIKGWQSIDRTGNRTTVELSTLRTGLEMNKALFDIRALEAERYG